MSGHSKWNNIKRKKEKTDAAKAKIFTKIGREIAVASTKAFHVQTLILLLLATWLSFRNNRMTENEVTEITKNIKNDIFLLNLYYKSSKKG